MELTQREWEKFGELLEKIINMPGTYADKAAAVKANIDESNLNEFVSWFPDESDD